MQKKLEEILKECKEACANSSSSHDLENIRIKFLGRKGSITSILRNINSLDKSEKPKIGSIANETKKQIEKIISETQKTLKSKEKLLKIELDEIDITLPGRKNISGKLHPITQVLNETIEIFTKLGFQIKEGPEIELDYYNFEALNFPSDHPARDMQDTFFVEEKIILRTHTSPVQIRTMEIEKPPLRIIAPGKVYRCDSDISHTPMFHQMEGFMVDKNISFADLKGMLELFIHAFFGKNTKLRFRPSFFPFTEPSAEIDISCVICHGKGCRVCKQSGWLEILGAGMIDPEVFKYVKYDSEIFTGFAFGMGIERISMLKFGITDIRLFFENDLRFLQQF
ncbi:MAG: phenylalanine--tRNA ligase subunit alpha [Candidatus Firestonebacteria bacterium]|nr:phenylalanine--tRNA ligase subunit alpha [Candidatus Firestonebacteria bacterium]